MASKEKDWMDDESWITQHPGTKCPVCGFVLNASGNPLLYGGDPPKEGDITICLQCGQPFEYQKDLRLKPMTAADIAMRNRQQPGLLEEIEKMQQFTIENQQRGEEGANG